jgi:hypothetical protein
MTSKPAKAEFAALTLELGEEVIESLHLDYEKYIWARSVLDAYGLIFMASSGEKVEALVPGVELLSQIGGSEAAPRPSNVRLETSDANFSEPTVVVYANKSYSCGDHVQWQSMRQYRVPGVACVVKFPYEDCGKSVADNLCNLLGGSPIPKPGDSCAVDEDVPVQVCLEGGKSCVNVTLRFTQDKPLPSKDIISLIGVGLLADYNFLTACMKDEAAVPCVMQEGMCEKRALRFLKPKVAKLLSDGTPEDSAILRQTVQEIDARLAAELSPSTGLASKSMKALLSISADTARIIAWPAEMDKELEALKAFTKDLQAMKSPPKEKIQMMQAWLKSTIFGDPAAVPLATTKSDDQIVSAYSEAAKAEMEAWVKCHEAESSKMTNSILKAQALAQRGTFQMRMNCFTDALASFQQSLQAASTPTTVTMALECAKSLHAQAEPSDLAMSSDLEAALLQLKKVLKREGYFSSGLPVPARLPAALSYALAGTYFGPESVLAQALSGSSDVTDVVELVRLFMLHQPMPVKTVRLLLGKEVCTALLSTGMLACFDPKTAQALPLNDAKKVVSEPKSRGASLIFSNVALQPLDDLVVVSDFDYGLMIPGQYEPEPYVAQDNAAIAASFAALVESNVAFSGAKTLVDSIPAGLVAASCGAKVCFAGCKRFQQFAQLSCALNGFSQDCEFTTTPTGKFDFVLASVVSLPNPDMVIGNKGPMFKHGMEESWKTCLKDGMAKLEPKGILLMSANVQNSGFSKTKLEGLLDGKSRAAVFTSKPSKVEDLLINLATGCAPVHLYAYMIGLQKAGLTSMSEALVLVSKDAQASGGVEMMSERKSLWADRAALQSGVQNAFASFVQSAAVQTLVAARAGEIYELDWDEDAGSTTASDAAGEEAPKEAVPRNNPWATIKSKKAECKRIKNQERNDQLAGGTWDEVANATAMGWAPPINVFSSWRVSPYPQKAGEMPSEMPRVAVVELPGISIPSDFMDAVRDTFDVKTKYTFSGESKKFSQEAAGKSRRRRRYASDEEANVSIDTCPIIMVPIPPGCYQDKAIVDLPLQMIYFAQYFADKVREGAQLLIMVITCNAFGPVMDEYSDTVSMAGALSGMCRTLRVEVRGMNMWNIDLDNFIPGGDCMEVMAQISLELNCPDHNYEIAWRKGKRWIRAFKLSARNPIRGPAIGPKFPWAADEPNGVVFITGGTGGLGVVSAEAFIEAGARRIVLGSRSGRVTAQGQGLEERIEKMQQIPGVQLILEKCDTSQEEQVVDALERCRKLGPLKVIVHAAGVLADTILDFQSEDTMKKSFLPKADGAWYLHKYTLQDDLTAFCCFSSVSSLHGNPGQANYSASNAYMDTLCRMRNYNGLPGMALMWPAVAEVGMAAAGILAKVEFDEMTQVKPGVVKTVMRLCCCNQYPLEDLVAVLPLGTFWPNAPNMAIVTEPLFTWYRDPKAFNEAVKVAEESDEYKHVLANTQGKVMPH